MTSTGDNPDAPTVRMTEREELLAALLDSLVEQAQRGTSPDVEAVVREHPDLAAELRELWATAILAENFASLSGELEDLGHRQAGTEKSWTGQSCPALARPGQEDGQDCPSHNRRVAAEGAEFGDYVLLEELGRGGMGVVYKAQQKSLDRTVALKMILQGELASAADLARFQAEAESAARLEHAHIVPVYEVGRERDRPFFSMKYIEGTTLARLLADGPLPPREAARLLVPVCRAIADAHRRGVLHRDLKPSNILIDGEGQPYVSDFGLAKRLPTAKAGEQAASLTLSGAILGTPSYMAPEQAAGQRGEISRATDIYSLGAILYAMLTGRPPFQSASPVDTVLLVLEQEPLPPRMLNPQADADLEMIALKCLQKPPDLRYENADALADDLEAYLADEPIAARSSHFSQILTRAFRETHHAAVLENWGLLWMWHSLVLLILCLVTNWFQWQAVTSRLPYLALWIVGLGAWAGIFWELRRRSGPITFVERQIAHVWAGSMASSTLLFGVEWLLGLPVLSLSPVLALIAASVFLAKAGILSGKFYVPAAALFVTGLAMALLQSDTLPDFGLTLFGVVTAAGFFFPGWKYHRQRRQGGVRD